MSYNLGTGEGLGIGAPKNNIIVLKLQNPFLAGHHQVRQSVALESPHSALKGNGSISSQKGPQNDVLCSASKRVSNRAWPAVRS